MLRLRGTPFEVGQQHGVVLGPRLRAGIDRYLATLERNHGLDHDRLQAEAMGALAGLPPRFREESLGLADGAGLTVEEVARWQHADACRRGCTAVLWQVAGDWWVARNNDVDPIDGPGATSSCGRSADGCRRSASACSGTSSRRPA
jgi:hypothetical protein